MKQFDGIEEALDVETSLVPKKESKMEIVPATTSEQLKKDYDYTRGNLYSLIEKGQEAVDGILEVAQSSDCLLYTSPSPRDKRQSRMPSSA